MPVAYEIEYQPANRVEQFVAAAGLYYQLGDGSRLEVETTPAWCRRCRRLVDGEKIEPLAEIEREYAALGDPLSTAYRMIARGVVQETTGKGDEFHREYVAWIKRRRQWRVTRASPPHCLTCGTADVLVFPLNEPTPHPAGDGTVRVSLLGPCDVPQGTGERLFTPEGQRVGRDKRPAFWAGPPFFGGLRGWASRRARGGGEGRGA